MRTTFNAPVKLIVMSVHVSKHARGQGTHALQCLQMIHPQTHYICSINFQAMLHAVRPTLAAADGYNYTCIWLVLHSCSLPLTSQ